MNCRTEHLEKFYTILGKLAHQVGGGRKLLECSGRLNWPKRGVYFFMEPGEFRSDSGEGPRIVRVGTHALKEGSGTELWGRLRQHRGSARSGGGNHRGSIFRLLVGTAVLARERMEHPTWDDGRSTAPSDVRRAESELEKVVSATIGEMPFLWLEIGDAPGDQSERGFIERNAIALLSNFGRTEPLDPPSPGWLGNHCTRQRVRASGLWNSNHVDEQYDPSFLDRFEQLVDAQGR